MAELRFRVQKPFTWDGKGYKKGEQIGIQEGNPRLRGMLQANHVRYDDSTRSEETPSGTGNKKSG
jgi:hypothetical protein